MTASPKILIDCRPVRAPVSGVARYCIGLSSALTKLDARVTCLAQGGDRNREPLSQILAPRVFGAFGASDFMTKAMNGVHEYLPGVAAALIPGKYDVAHETYFANLGAFERKIVTIHDLFPIEYPQNYSSRNVKYSVRNLRRQCGEASRIIAVSRYTKERIVEMEGVHPDKIVVIGNGVNIPKVDSQEEPPLKSQVREVLADPRPFVLYVGNIEPRKNISRLIRAWQAALKRLGGFARLVIAGRPIHGSVPIMEEMLADTTQSISYVGTVTELEKALLLKSMHALVFPSLLEGFGIPVLEAYLSEKPCIMSRCSALTELAVSPSQLFDPEDVDSMIDALESLFADYSAFMSLLPQTSLIARQASWVSVARLTMELYDAVSA